MLRRLVRVISELQKQASHSEEVTPQSYRVPRPIEQDQKQQREFNTAAEYFRSYYDSKLEESPTIPKQPPNVIPA